MIRIFQALGYHPAPYPPRLPPPPPHWSSGQALRETHWMQRLRTTGNGIPLQNVSYVHLGKHRTPMSKKWQRFFLTISVWVFRSPALAQDRATADPHSGIRGLNADGGSSCYSPGKQLVHGRPRLEARVSILHSQKPLTTLKITGQKELEHTVKYTPEWGSIKWSQQINQGRMLSTPPYWLYSLNWQTKLI